MRKTSNDLGCVLRHKVVFYSAMFWLRNKGANARGYCQCAFVDTPLCSPPPRISYSIVLLSNVSRQAGRHAGLGYACACFLVAGFCLYALIPAVSRRIPLLEEKNAWVLWANLSFTQAYFWMNLACYFQGLCLWASTNAGLGARMQLFRLSWF